MYGYGNSMFLATHGILARSASGGGFDPDAQAFITAASITNPTQQSAINTLVVDLKGYNIWTKFKAIYPIVGGVASSHAVNLKTPGTFNLTFTNAWTHSSTGMTPNGTSAYANTSLNPISAFSVDDNVHISYYSRTNSATANSVEIGATDGSKQLLITIRRSDSGGNTYYCINTSGYINYVDSNSAALYIGTRIGSTHNGFRNNIKVATGSPTSSIRPNLNILLGAQSYNLSPFIIQYSSRQCAFASIGDGFTDTEAVNFYTAVQAFQTTLSRQV